jgi:probable rRNA maturation factor
MPVYINNLSDSSFTDIFFKRIAKMVLDAERVKEKHLSIVLVGPEEIKKLNKKYRKKNEPTDVLSFSGESQKFIVPDETEKELGEIVICPSVVRKNAKKFQSVFEKEMAKVLIHGILHLLGYDHLKKTEAEIMERKQEQYLLKYRF